MQKSLPYLLLFILALLIFDGLTDAASFSLHLDDAGLEGPFGTLLGALLAGGGMIVGTLVLLLIGLALAVLFAGLGIVAIIALVLAAALGLLALSPLLLPLLIPVAIVWLLVRRKSPRHPTLHHSAQ